MAEPFDTLAAQLVAVLEGLIAETVTPEVAIGDVAEIYESLSLNSGTLEAVKATLGRVRGMFVVSAPPSDFLGVPGSTAFDPTNRIWYGPKDAVTGWPTGVAFVDQGPSGTITAVTAVTLAPGEDATVTAGGTAQARTFAFGIPKGDTGDGGDIVDVTIETLAAGADATVTRGGTAGERTLHLGIPRGDTGADTALATLAIQERADLYDLLTPGAAAAFVLRGTEHDNLAAYFRSAAEAEDVATDLTGYTGGCSTGGYGLRVDGSYQLFGANVPRITDLGRTSERDATSICTRFAPTVAQLSAAAGASNVSAPASPPIAGLNWLAMDNSASLSLIYLTATIAGSTEYSFSFWCETPDGTAPVVGTTNSNGDFRVTVGGTTALTGQVVSYKRRSGNVWEVKVTGTTLAEPNTTIGLLRYTTQSLRALKFSGFQMQTGKLRTSPMITTGAAVTRTADTDQQVLPATVTEGTLLFDGILPEALPASPTTGLMVLLNAGNSQWVGLRVTDTGVVSALRRTSAGDAATINSAAGVGVAGQRVRVAFSFGLDGTDHLSINGAAAVSAAGASTAHALTHERLGRFLTDPGHLNGPVRQCAYLPKRMNAAEVQSLSAL